MVFRDFHFFPSHRSPVLIDNFDFGRLDMLDIVYSDSTNYSRPLDNQDLRAKLCKMKPILQKKG